MKPILFNTEMVRAILDGRKTVTRRVAFSEKDLRPFQSKDYPDGWWFRGRVYRSWDDATRTPQGVMSLCRYRREGVLYVRETWLPLDGDHIIDGRKYAYRADSTEDSEQLRTQYGYKWHPSIHMPKEAARIFLRVQDVHDVHVERVQEITGAECVREGIPQESLKEVGEAFTVGQFADLWDSTVKPSDRALYGWDANPWVWVIDFERISRDEALKEESK